MKTKDQKTATPKKKTETKTKTKAKETKAKKDGTKADAKSQATVTVGSEVYDAKDRALQERVKAELEKLHALVKDTKVELIDFVMLPSINDRITNSSAAVSASGRSMHQAATELMKRSGDQKPSAAGLLAALMKDLD